MSGLSRRRFLQQLLAIPAAALTARIGIAQSDPPFDFLVVGDSLVWGQGLEEPDKFYTLTRNWLDSDIVGQPVRIKIKAHSGSTLTIHPNEESALKKAGRDESSTILEPEINVGFPSIKSQLETAHKEYVDPRTVRLIMLSGSITDISVAAILNPFGDNKQLRSDIDKYCLNSMSEVLSTAARLFPNAIIAVIGYYPMISPKTKTHDLLNFALEAYGVPRPLKPIANNPLTHPILRAMIAKKALKRSRIWIDGSNTRIAESVERLNASLGSRRAVFIKAPINEENTYGTKNSLVFKMLKKGRIEDSFYDRRREQCGPVLTELKKTTGLKYPIRFCDMAAVGHPNPSGSRAYFEAIRAALDPVLPR